MRVGLVGFAGSGKTTVFNTMTGLDVPVGFGGEVRLGTVRVPDERVDDLAAAYEPRKTTFAEINFCDVPGEHGSEQRGLSPNGLHQLRDQDALCLVLRGFENPSLQAPPDPESDLEAFHLECLFADLEVVERRLERARKERANPQEITALEAVREALQADRPVRSIPAGGVDRALLRGFGLLTNKPLLVALNRREDEAAESMPKALSTRIAELHAAGFTLSASVEAEIAALDPEEHAAFLEDMGLGASALARFIRTSFELLELISFFTVGPDEVRAWTVRRGTDVRTAAGRIHSDLERGFIRAEVIPFDVLTECGSERAVKELGKLRVEGKGYLVRDGDIVHVLFSV